MAARKPASIRLPSLLLAVLALALAALALLTAAPQVHAQKGAPKTPTMSDSDKAKLLDQKLYERQTDEAYKKSLQRIPDAQQKVDPWGGVREETKKK